MEDKLNKIINITFPSIYNSDITEEGKKEMYNLYFKKGYQCINTLKDFQELSKVYKKYNYGKSN